MAWLRRSGAAPPTDAPADAGAQPEPIEGAAPGVTAVLENLGEGSSLALLDLGASSGESLRVYGRYARWIRFADLLGEPWLSRAAAPGLQLPALERSQDLVFAWDILDRLFPDDRLRLVAWLADATVPGARLHAIVRASELAIAQPLRFTLVKVGTIRYEPAGTSRLPAQRLLPAEVGRVLAPFQVVHAFTLKNGLREYVALRR